tara:strand:+ start:29 stop:472 length:444 start_codon:yes stop_codon:yes gene_type:complete
MILIPTTKLKRKKKMSQRFNIVEDFPAVTYVEFTNTDKANKVFSGELIKLKSNYTTQQLATVISCAVENSQDPIAELETAIKFGHDTHFAFSIGSSLSSQKQEKKRVIIFSEGDRIKLEGKEFYLKKSPNDNVKLVEILEPSVAVAK